MYFVNKFLQKNTEAEEFLRNIYFQRLSRSISITRTDNVLLFKFKQERFCCVFSSTEDLTSFLFSLNFYSVFYFQFHCT